MSQRHEDNLNEYLASRVARGDTMETKMNYGSGTISGSAGISNFPQPGGLEKHPTWTGTIESIEARIHDILQISAELGKRLGVPEALTDPKYTPVLSTSMARLGELNLQTSRIAERLNEILNWV